MRALCLVYLDLYHYIIVNNHIDLCLFSVIAHYTNNFGWYT